MSYWHDRLTEDSQKVCQLAKLAAQLFGDEPQNRCMWTISRLCNFLDELTEPQPDVPWSRDISQELATNSNCPGLLRSGWWQRTLDQITHVTLHHTLSNSPHGTARHYVNKDGGRPSIPYTIWVTETGEVLLCDLLMKGCWHDHTGHENTHLSVGLAGSLHKYRPSTPQLISAAKVCKWAIESPEMSKIDSIDKITGHMDWIATACPGWLGTGEGKPSGEWKSFFYGLLEEML